MKTVKPPALREEHIRTLSRNDLDPVLFAELNRLRADRSACLRRDTSRPVGIPSCAHCLTISSVIAGEVMTRTPSTGGLMSSSLAKQGASSIESNPGWTATAS